jgi:hypothetical protein
MKKNALPLLALLILIASQLSATGNTRIGKPGYLENGLRTITLYSRIGHHISDYGATGFNFTHGLRSDDELWLPITHNSAEILYGSIALNGDSDWFSVSMGGDNPSKITDLGVLDWSDIKSIPELPATPPTTEGIRGPALHGDPEVMTENRVTNAVDGHLYLVHIKNAQTNIYAMFKIVELVPSDNCTISWKLVKAPENS